MAKNPNGSDDENDEDEYSFDQLPDKCEKANEIGKTLVPSGSDSNQEETKPSVPQLAIPKLDLTRAR